MKVNGKPSWSVLTEGTEDLNFAIYVACTYDLLPITKPFSSSKCWSSTTTIKILSEDEKKVLRGQWIKWWNSIILARSKNDRFVEFYSPTYFESLPSELSQIALELREPFLEWWHMPAGGNTAMIFWESADNVGEYVREFERKEGRVANPFKLKVDLVYTGLDDVIEFSDEYAIMPLRSNHENKGWWIEKIKSIG